MQPPGVTSHITSGDSERPRTRPKRTAAERNYRPTVVGSIDSASLGAAAAAAAIAAAVAATATLFSDADRPRTDITRVQVIAHTPTRRRHGRRHGRRHTSALLGAQYPSHARTAAGCPNPTPTPLLDSAARPTRLACPARPTSGSAPSLTGRLTRLARTAAPNRLPDRPRCPTPTRTGTRTPPIGPQLSSELRDGTRHTAHTEQQTV